MSKDTFTADLFADLPKAVPLDTAAIDLQVMIAKAMSKAMKAFPHDRYEIASRMSRAMHREVSKNMLDAYASPARDTHIPNLEFCIYFDYVTGQHTLCSLHATLLGCSVLEGDEALRAKLGQLDVQEKQIRATKKELTEYLASKGDKHELR